MTRRHKLDTIFYLLLITSAAISVTQHRCDADFIASWVLLCTAMLVRTIKEAFL